MPPKYPALPQMPAEDGDPGMWRVTEMAQWLVKAKLKGFDVFYPVLWMGETTQPQVVFWPMSTHVAHHHDVFPT